MSKVKVQSMYGNPCPYCGDALILARVSIDFNKYNTVSKRNKFKKKITKAITLKHIDECPAARGVISKERMGDICV